MRLKYQLFLTLLAMGAILIALTAVIGRWNFERGFIGYINNTERQRLQPLVDALAEGYTAEENWQWITSDPSAWGLLLDRHWATPKPRPDSAKRSSGPAKPDTSVDIEGPPHPDAPPFNRGKRKHNDKILNALTMDPRLLLADSQKLRLIGPARDNEPVHWLPVRVNEQTVGYLGYHERQALTGQLDKAFASQQRRSFFYTACAMALLSALLAVVLASRLVRPLLSVNDAVARIGRGQYSYRVPDAGNDEIGDLSRSINTLAGTLEKNLNARRQWLAEISHELRTPLAVLQSEIEAIQDGVQRLDQIAIASLHAETLRLARLIDDLHDLTLSDVGALDYIFEPLDVRQLLSERVRAARSQTEASNLSVTITPTASDNPTPLILNGDVQRLGQLLDNLLQNSIRYTDTGGTLRIDTSIQNGRITIDWEDSTPGVNDEQRKQLFEPLYRADTSRNRNHGGAGLGLAIAQRIVEAHGGTISARHSTLGGLALRIELPLAPKSAL